jgi:hypothetical protein
MSEQVNIDPELVDNQNNNESVESDDSSDDSSDELNEMDTVIFTHSIPEHKKIHKLCDKSTLVKLELADNKSISTEFKYVMYFFKKQLKNVFELIDEESGNESDSESEDRVIEFNVQYMTEELYMKYSAELYTLCYHLKKMYVYDEENDSDVATYSIIKDMDEHGVPKYCQDWIKSKRLPDLEIYCQSTTDDTNVTGQFKCSIVEKFISYWFAYLSIHEDIALLYCDKSYYDELSKVFNDTVGVYNPEKFSKYDNKNIV